MFVDQSLIVADNVTVRGSDPDYSSSIDLTLSPELGSGGQLVAVVAINAWTAGSATAVIINIVTSSVTGLDTTPRVIGSMTILAADLEFADAAGLDIAAHCAPFVIRANPDHGVTERGGTGTAERYLGLQFDHIGATPTVLDVTAYFTNDYQGDPHSNAGTAGMTVV